MSAQWAWIGLAGMMLLGWDATVSRIQAQDTEAVEAVLEATNAPAEEVSVPATNAVIVGIDVSNLVTTAMGEAQKSFLLLQEQLRASMLTLEQARRASDAAAADHAAAFSNRLATLNTALEDQRRTEFAWMQHSNRTLLIALAGFAGVVMVLMVVTVWYQGRSFNRLAEIALAARETYPAPVLAPIEPAGPALLPAPEESSRRLLGALEHLEKRIRELEQTAAAPAPFPDREPAPEEYVQAVAATAAGTGSAGMNEELTGLLGRGQTMLNSGEVEQALACFDEVIAREPQHAEALMKKGMALERQEKYKEALDYYDRAIEANRSLTLAYLHKGGVFNQLERFDEALQCYEQALRLQQLTSQPGGG